MPVPSFGDKRKVCVLYWICHVYISVFSDKRKAGVLYGFCPTTDHLTVLLRVRKVTIFPCLSKKRNA